MLQQNPQQILQQPPQVMLVPQPKADDAFRRGAVTQIKVMSGIQIGMGALCMVMGIILIPLDVLTAQYGLGVSSSGYGIWLGAMFIGLGVMGIRATKSKSKRCMISAMMILNIIFAAIGFATSVTLNIIGILFNNWDGRCLGNGGYHDGNYYHGSTTSSDPYMYTTRRPYCFSGGVDAVFVAFESLMLIMALIELAINIWVAVLCCKVVCRCCKKGSPAEAMALYSVDSVSNAPLQPQPMITYPGVSQNYSYGQSQQQPYFPSGVGNHAVVGSTVNASYMNGYGAPVFVVESLNNPPTNQNANIQPLINSGNPTVVTNQLVAQHAGMFPPAYTPAAVNGDPILLRQAVTPGTSQNVITLSDGSHRILAAVPVEPARQPTGMYNLGYTLSTAHPNINGAQVVIGASALPETNQQANLQTSMNVTAASPQAVLTFNPGNTALSSTGSQLPSTNAYQPPISTGNPPVSARNLSISAENPSIDTEDSAISTEDPASNTENLLISVPRPSIGSPIPPTNGLLPPPPAP